MPEEVTADYPDPQFMNTLESCLKSEITQLKSDLTDRHAAIKKIQTDIAWKWKEAKNLDERIKDCQENIQFFSVILESLERYDTNLQSQLDVMRANLDDAFRVMSHEIKQHEVILQQYQETWEQYKAQYEDAPLAKDRSEVRINLEKLHIKEMVFDYKHKDLTKKIQQSKRICWLRLRSKIVEFAEVMMENRGLNQRLANQRVEIQKSKEELRAVTAELEFQKKKFEDENKKRSQQLLEMPPPKMYLPLYRKNDMKQMDSSKIGEQLMHNKFKKSSDTDTVSITGSIYAEILHQEEEDCPSTQSQEAEVTQFQRSNSYSQRSISREIPAEDLNLTDKRVEEELIPIDEEENREPTQMERELEERRSVPVIDLEKVLNEDRGSKKEQEKSDAERAHFVPEEIELEPAMKRMRMTVNQNVEDRTIRDTPCSTTKVHRWQEPKDRNILFRENSGRSEKIREPKTPRIVNVEKVHVEAFSKFGRQNIVPNIPYSNRNYYCESDAISGLDGLANIADVGSLCADSIADFSGCTNLSPPFSMMGEKEMQNPVESKPTTQANNKRNNFQAFGFGCSSSNKPGPTKFF